MTSLYWMASDDFLYQSVPFDRNIVILGLALTDMANSHKTGSNEKVKLASVFTEAPSHKAIWESGGNSPSRSKPEF
jgi:hypothetical protein